MATRAAVRVAMECSIRSSTEACRSQQSPGMRNEVIWRVPSGRSL